VYTNGYHEVNGGGEGGEFPFEAIQLEGFQVPGVLCGLKVGETDSQAIINEAPP
jgi:hypothetical protein